MGVNYPFDFTNREEVLLVPLEPPVSISFDFGAVYEGYCYDFGRSVFFGEPDEEYQRCYELVIIPRQRASPRSRRATPANRPSSRPRRHRRGRLR